MEVSFAGKFIKLNVISQQAMFEYRRVILLGLKPIRILVNYLLSAAWTWAAASVKDIRNFEFHSPQYRVYPIRTLEF